MNKRYGNISLRSCKTNTMIYNAFYVELFVTVIKQEIKGKCVKQIVQKFFFFRFFFFSTQFIFGSVLAGAKFQSIPASSLLLIFCRM